MKLLLPLLFVLGALGSCAYTGYQWGIERGHWDCGPDGAWICSQAEQDAYNKRHSPNGVANDRPATTQQRLDKGMV